MMTIKTRTAGPDVCHWLFNNAAFILTVIHCTDKTIDYNPVSERHVADIKSSRDYLYRDVYRSTSGEERAVTPTGSDRHGHF